MSILYNIILNLLQYCIEHNTSRALLGAVHVWSAPHHLGVVSFAAALQGSVFLRTSLIGVLAARRVASLRSRLSQG